MLKNVNWGTALGCLLAVTYLAAVITGISLIIGSNWTIWQKIAMLILVLV